MRACLRTMLRMLALAVGLLVMLSLLALAALLVLTWLARAMWARLRGRPVSPWTFQFNRTRWRPTAGTRPGRVPDDADVIDVEPKAIRSSNE